MNTPSVPSWGKSFALGIQHVLLIMGGVVLVPAILAEMYDVELAQVHKVVFATVLGSGVATLMQLVGGRRFGFGGLMFMSSSAVYLACAHSAIKMGGFGMFAALGLASAPVIALAGVFLRHLRPILTPTVGGVIIMLAVVGMLKDATATWTGNMAVSGHEAYARMWVGAVTAAVLVAAEWLGGRRLRPWCLLLGMAAGTLVAWPAGLLDLSRIQGVPLLGLPHADWHLDPGQASPERLLLYLTYVVAALVTSIKYTGDAMAMQRVIGRAKGETSIDYEAIQGGLYAAAAGSAFSGLMGGMPLASHSPNVPLAKMTRTTARRVGVAGAAILVALAFSPKALFALMCIPSPVVGATAVVLVAHLFATGMLLAASGGLSFHNGFIVGLSLTVGLMMQYDFFFPNAFPPSLTPVMNNGFAAGGTTALLLTVLHKWLVERWDSFKLASAPKAKAEMTARLGALAAKYNLDERTANFLELACEEVFFYIIAGLGDSAKSSQVMFRLRLERENVHVEVSCRTRIDGVEGAVEMEPALASEEELERLGLFLLHKLASRVHVANVSGYAYVGFRLPAG